MEIKATLKKQYTEEQRINFIVAQNHKNGYEIRESADALEAWGYTEEEITQKEKERIARLYLTGADVERGIYQAKGMDFDDIIAMVTKLQPEGLDIKSLKIELKANNFYRGNPYVSAVGALIGFTTEQLDKFFETKDYKYLTTCTLIINATPIEATVTGAGVYPYGTVVDVNVECEEYVTHTETVTLIEDKTLNIKLDEVIDENTTNYNESDVQDELDTTTSKSDEINTDILE